MAVNSVVNDGNTNNYTELDLTLNVNSTYIWQKYGKYLECCEDRRVKWLGDLTYLKDFVSSLYGNVRKWNSPGASAKCIRHDQICLTWHANKTSLLFQGEEGNKLKDLIIKCYKNSDLAHDHANTCEQEPIVLVNNGRRESPNECQNCSRLFAEMTEVNRKIDGLHEIVNNLYQLNTKFVNYEYSRNDDKRSTCELGTQTDLYSEQSVAQHPSVIQTADINLATEIEGLKLDFVIIESKTARDLEANRQAIEQLRGELATVGEKIRCSQGCRVLPNDNAKEKLNHSTQLSFQTPINVHANHGNSNSIQPCVTHSPTNCAEKTQIIQLSQVHKHQQCVKLIMEESRQFGKTESSGIHQESPNTRLAQSPEPCTPYYDLRTASHGYYESMTLNTNIIPLTSIFHNLVSDSLNIQNCQIFDSEFHPRWNCSKYRPTTRTLITIPSTRLSYDFPTFFLSNSRSMANKLDEISATITNNKCDVAIITESWLSSSITNDLIKIPGFS
ncbi:Hypothetical predicted protein, partial [Paramuricea clavata]